MRPTTTLKMVLAVLFLVSCAVPSWAWRGGFGWRGGWRGGWGGPRVGVYLGPGPWWGGPDYYDPYYPYPSYYPGTDPYAPSYAQTAPSASVPQSSSSEQIAKQRAQIEYAYEDGDISKAERDTQLKALAESPQSREPAAAASFPSPAPSYSAGNSHRDLTAVNDLHLELSILLDQKLKENAITKTQHDAEMAYLDKLSAQARSEAAANGGSLSADQEDALVQQLHHAYYLINHNFIGYLAGPLISYRDPAIDRWIVLPRTERERFASLLPTRGWLSEADLPASVLFSREHSFHTSEVEPYNALLMR